MKISFGARGFSPIKIDYTDYPKSLSSRINEVYVVFICGLIPRNFAELAEAVPIEKKKRCQS